MLEAETAVELEDALIAALDRVDPAVLKIEEHTWRKIAMEDREQLQAVRAAIFHRTRRSSSKEIYDFI